MLFFLSFLVLTERDGFIIADNKFSRFTLVQPLSVTKVRKLLLVPLPITSLVRTEHLLAVAKIT